MVSNERKNVLPAGQPVLSFLPHSNPNEVGDLGLFPLAMALIGLAFLFKPEWCFCLYM